MKPLPLGTVFSSLCHDHIKIVASLILLFLQIEASYAQDAQLRTMVPPAPEVATLSRFGDYPVSQYTGSPSISVPLFTLNENGLDLPITLDYNANGVRVADYSTWVGLGWNLSPGGSISRIVVGDKEDNHNAAVYDAIREQWYPGTDCDYVRLFFNKDIPIHPTTYAFLGCEIEAVPVELTESSPGDEISSQVILPQFPVESMTAWAQAAHFFQPDIYSFNFLGYSGKFYINPQTNLAVILDKKDAITFEKDKNNTTWNPEEDGWIAKLPNGIEVYFQEVESVEQAVSSCTSGEPSLTWKISRIVLNNNREITFNYTAHTYSTAIIANIDQAAFLTQEDFDHNRLQRDLFNAPYLDFSCNGNRRPIEVINKVKVLQGITSSKYQVDFTLFAKETKPRLQKLEIRSRLGSTIKKGFEFDFSQFKKASFYTQWNQWNRWSSNGLTTDFFGDESNFIKYKLISVKEYGIQGTSKEYAEPYQFSYVEDIGLASPFTFAQDYWGYYNGQHNNGGLIPDESQMYEGGLFADNALKDAVRLNVDFRTEANSNRGVSVDHMKQGVLDKMTYPTKGYTAFNFEPHHFIPSSEFGSYIIEAENIVYNSASRKYQENYNGSANTDSRGAGLRISEITNYSNDNSFISRRKFSYQGGKLLEPINFWRLERYMVARDNSGTTTNETEIFYYHVWTGSGTNYNQSFLIPNSVGYNTVVVEESDNEVNQKTNGSTLYQFHNYETLYNPQAGQISYSYLNNKNGLLRNVEQKDNSGNVVRSAEYVYQRIEQSEFLSMSAKVVVPASSSINGLFRIDYMPFKSDWWKQSTTTETLDGVQTIKNYNYSDDGWGNVASVNLTNSDQKDHRTIYQYATDFPEGGITYGSNLLRANHMHSQVLEQTTTVGEESSIVATQKVTTTYGNPSGNIVPTRVENYPTGTNEAISTNYEYDDRGNVRQVLGQDGVPTAFIWGYNHTLPVAQVVGVAYDIAATKVNLTALQTMDGQILRDELDKLRTLSKALITTYTYDPLAGVISITDPARQIKTFEYDGLGRLKLIRDNAGKIVENYKYHYINQPHP